MDRVIRHDAAVPAMSDPPVKPASRPSRGSKPVTVKRLENAAAAYLARYDASSARLRAVLARRVFNARRRDAPVVADVEAVIERIVARYVANGLIDDARYAERRAGSLHRRGVSSRHIREKLKLAGIARDGAELALDATREELDLDEADLDLRAAVALARRRRLGPFRATGRPERRDRDLAALARAGFAFDIARRVIDADDAEALLADGAGS
jgi:regulatory protein